MKLILISILGALICLVSSQKYPRIYSLHIRSDIKYRFATTLVTSKVVNPDTVSREATFDATLPNEAFISKFKLIINNKTYDGEVKEKEEAKQQYEAAKERGQSAGHIVAKPRETNKFQIMVNVAAREKVIFELTYQEVLRRIKGRYSHVTYIDPGDVVNDMVVEVAITESRDLTSLRVPPIRSDILTDVIVEQNNAIAVIERPSPKTAYIKYSPTLAQQRVESDKGVRGQFIVEYDIDRKNNAGELLVVNGYFVHYFAPDGLASLPMDVVFILDKSGSMKGKKIQQVREAMRKILREMSDDDRFTIMTFDSRIAYWKQTLVGVTDRSLTEANDFVDKIIAQGSTNINEALGRGLDLLTSASDSSRAPVIVFLTDGQPTSGETKTDRILANVREKNVVDVPIFSLAFGRGADYQFTKKLAAQNNGLGRKIYEDSDSALQISGLYKEISTVLMKNVTFRYLDGNVNQSSLTKTNFNTYFGGKEIMVCGVINDIMPMPTRARRVMPLEVTGMGVNGSTISLVGIDTITIPDENDGIRIGGSDVTLNLTIKGDFSKITEKLWAYMTIKQLLQEKDAVTDVKRLKELDKQVLHLSLKYQFVTPLTSMVVTLPDILKTSPKLFTDLLEDDVGLSTRPGGSQTAYSPVSSMFTNSFPRRPLRPLSSFSTGIANILPRPFVSSVFSNTKRKLRLPLRPTSLVGNRLNRKRSKKRNQKKHTSKSSKPRTQKRKTKVPSVLIKLQGLTLPLCMDLALDRGDYILLNTTSQNSQHDQLLTIVEATLGRGRSIFTAVSHQGGGVSGSLSPVSNHSQSGQSNPPDQGTDQIMVNVSRMTGTNTDHFQVYVQIPSKELKVFSGILDVFNGMTGKLIKQKVKKKKKVIGRIQLHTGSEKTKLRGMQFYKPYPGLNACWYLNGAAVRKKLIAKSDIDKYRL